MCWRKGRVGRGGRRQKSSSPQTRMCVCFKKVQSDDPQSPDSFCNTFTKARGEGENPAPLSIPLIIPHYLQVALESGMSTRNRRYPVAACHWRSPCVTCKVCCFCHWFGQQVLGCSSFPPASCRAWEEGPASPASCLPASDSEKIYHTLARYNKKSNLETAYFREGNEVIF